MTGLGFCLVFLVSFVVAYPRCADGSDICGSGSTFAQELYRIGAIGFVPLYASSINTESPSTILKITYLGTGSGTGRLAANSSLPKATGFSFGGSDSPYTSTEIKASQAVGTLLRNYPVAFGSIVMLYNLPGLNITLLLDRTVLPLIYNGNITRWNDPLLVNSQIEPSNLASIDQPINLILRRDTSGSTGIFTQFLATISPYWKANHGSFQNWTLATNWTANPPPNITFLSGDSVFSLIELASYSLAYVPYGIQTTKTVSKEAKLVNKMGQVVVVNATTLDAALANVVMFDNFTVPLASVLDSNASGAFPMVSPTYFLVAQNPFFPVTNCTDRRLTFLWLQWMLTSYAFGINLNTIGFSRINAGLITEMVIPDMVETFNCSSPLAAVVTENEKDLGAVVPLLTVMAVGMALCIVLTIAFLSVETKGILFTSYAVLVSFCVLFIYAAVIPFNIIPSTNSICYARFWVSFLGITLILGATVSRADVVRQIYNLSKTGDLVSMSRFASGSKLSNFIPSFRGPVVAGALQIVILIVWSCVDSYNSVIEVTDPILLLGEYRCYSSTYAYYITEAVFLTFWVLLGIWSVYRSWNFKSSSQSKWSLVSLYNFVVAGVILIPLLVFLPDERSTAIVISCILLFCATQALLTFYLPGFAEYQSLWRGSVGSRAAASLSRNPGGSRRKSSGGPKSSSGISPD